MNFLVIDIETTGLYFKDRILTIAASWREGASIKNRVWIVDPVLCEGMIEVNGILQIQVPDSIVAIQAELGGLVASCDRIVFHNGAFDLPFLLRDGILTDRQVRNKIYDTMLAARRTGPRDAHSLSALLDEYHIGPVTAEERSFYKRMKGIRAGLLNRDRHGALKIPTSDILRYNAMDTDYTLLLAERLWKESTKQYELDQITREHDFIRVVSGMTIRGQHVNVDALVQSRDEYSKKIRDLRAKIHAFTGAESEDQGVMLAKWFDRRPWFGRSVVLTGGGAPSFDKTAVPVYKKDAETYGDNDAVVILDAIQDARAANKIWNRIVEIGDNLDARDRLHGGFSVGKTTTYRLASSRPNVQNLPRDLKIWASYLGADYSQAELRYGALIARDPVLASMYAAGEDVHTQTALRMFGNRDDWESNFKHWRQVAKAVNFLSMYGGGPERLKDRLQQEGIFITLTQAKEYKDLHRRTYPKIYEAMRDATRVWESRGWLRIWDDSRIYLLNRERDRSFKAYNNVVQSGIAKIVQSAMCTLHDEGYPIVGQVHDEIRFDGDLIGDEQAHKHIAEIMTGALPLSLRSVITGFPPIEMAVDLEVKGIPLMETAL